MAPRRRLRRSERPIRPAEHDGRSAAGPRGERGRQTAAADGSASVNLRLQPSAANRIDVSVEDAFGQRAVRRIAVHQRPTPVLIVPGWATSGPRNLFDLPEFLMQRGYPADKLAVMGVAKAVVYGDLRTSSCATPAS